jgi:hypothetical protein
MKLRPIWTPKDAEGLRAAMATHPAYIALQQREADTRPPWMKHQQLEPEQLAAVIDIHTRERLA